MDDLDKAILDIIQSEFPLDKRPYEVIGQKVGASEAEVLSRVRTLREQGVIRRIGGNFQSAKLGFFSTLCGARVPQDKLDTFIATVNALAGVTHNYLRRHSYNVWFTFIGESEEHVQQTLDAITAATGVAILNLPAKRLFKIKVNFAMQDGKAKAEPMA